jgi:hypothetical protein
MKKGYLVHKFLNPEFENFMSKNKNVSILGLAWALGWRLIFIIAVFVLILQFLGGITIALLNT